MKFDIARQPFVPAFLTLLALILVWINHYAVPTELRCDITPAEQIAEIVEVGKPTEEAPKIEADSTESTIVKTDSLSQETAQPAEDLIKAAPIEEKMPPEEEEKSPRMAINLPATMIHNFVATHPVWGQTLLVFLVMFTGITMGRTTIRHNLYTVASCVPIPLSFALMLAVGTRSITAEAVVGAFFFAYAIKNYNRSFRSGYTFDANFRGSMYLGLTVATLPEALSLVLLFPVAQFIFHRTFREAIVGTAGLLLAPAVVAYANWGMGGDFTAPFVEGWMRITEGDPTKWFTAYSLPVTPMFTGIVILSLISICNFMINQYSVGTKPRFIIMFTISTLALSLTLLLVPASKPDTLMLFSLPASILITGFMIRISRPASTVIYLAIIAISIALQFI